MKRTVLITGASSGIGKAIAENQLEEGARVIGLARNRTQATTKHGDFHFFPIDLSELKSLAENLKQIVKQFPSPDTLILCAGQGRFGSLEEFSYEQIQGSIDLNFTSQAYVVRAFIQNLKKVENGNIIFIGSEAALQGGRKGSVYCAAKFALRGFAQALRHECARSGIRVTIINPGMVKTNFFNELDFEPGDDEDNYLLPTDIAEMVSLTLRLRRGTVVEEINCSPLKKVIRFKPK